MRPAGTVNAGVPGPGCSSWSSSSWTGGSGTSRRSWAGPGLPPFRACSALVAGVVYRSLSASTRTEWATSSRLVCSSGGIPRRALMTSSEAPDRRAAPMRSSLPAGKSTFLIAWGVSGTLAWAMSLLHSRGPRCAGLGVRATCGAWPGPRRRTAGSAGRVRRRARRNRRDVRRAGRPTGGAPARAGALWPVPRCRPGQGAVPRAGGPRHTGTALPDHSHPPPGLPTASSARGTARSRRPGHAPPDRPSVPSGRVSLPRTTPAAPEHHSPARGRTGRTGGRAGLGAREETAAGRAGRSAARKDRKGHEGRPGGCRRGTPEARLRRTSHRAPWARPRSPGFTRLLRGDRVSVPRCPLPIMREHGNISTAGDASPGACHRGTPMLFPRPVRRRDRTGPPPAPPAGPTARTAPPGGPRATRPGRDEAEPPVVREPGPAATAAPNGRGHGQPCCRVSTAPRGPPTPRAARPQRAAPVGTAGESGVVGHQERRGPARGRGGPGGRRRARHRSVADPSARPGPRGG